MSDWQLHYLLGQAVVDTECLLCVNTPQLYFRDTDDILPFFLPLPSHGLLLIFFSFLLFSILAECNF